jgi:hypothetical protein
MAIGVSIALLQMSVALSLVARGPSPRSSGGLAVLLLGGAPAAASLPDWNFSYLLHGEVIYQLGSVGASSNRRTLSTADENTTSSAPARVRQT